MVWRRLAAELARWSDAGYSVDVWWRDDDAIALSDHLEQLLALSTATGTRLAVAVIPAHAEEALLQRLGQTASVDILQHGYAHQNWMPPGAKKAEFGSSRSVAQALGDIEDGWHALNRLASSVAQRPIIPIFVPPWNRMAPAHLPQLVRAGFRGVSMFGRAATRNVVPGLTQLNTHLDIIDWRGSRGFVGARSLLGCLLDELRARREELICGPTADADLDTAGQARCEPIGLLTHHLVHDQACWDFLSRFFGELHDHPVLRWLSAGECLARDAWPRGKDR